METSSVNLNSIITTTVTMLANNTTTASITMLNTTDSTTTTETGLDVFDPTPGAVTEIVVLILLCILILLGNALVILAFIKGPRSIRTLTNYFVVNLAVCDFMVGCLSVPSWILLRLSKYIVYFIRLCGLIFMVCKLLGKDYTDFLILKLPIPLTRRLFM